ncbi:hypothetical protein [Paenibacillus andongensis]|uniref:hypothetical protein n=1 Tax=Paenibacillus andongensis TaxID=2975482 RepID=UPI0021BAFA06|nr:hypothetical protein [Paenibacillus andongensis]
MTDLEIKLSNILENKEQIYLEKMDSIHSVVELSRAELLEENKHKIDNSLFLLKESLLRDLDIINIKQHNLKPMPGCESMQSNLISSINNKDEEYDSYHILPTEILYALAKDKTAVVGNYSYVFNNYANTNNLPEVKALKPNITTLIEDVTGVDNIIISNINLSTLILLSQEFLFEMGQKIKGNLYLPVRTSKDPICVVWEGFSFSEKHDETYARWAEGDSKKALIKLYNTTQCSVEAEISCTSYALCGHGDLYIRGSFVQQCYDLSNPANIKIKLILNPGENSIFFDFYGDIVVPGVDKRKLSFNISNFNCRVHGNDISQTALNCTYPVYLNDDYIRNTLHKSGFYEVSAKVYRNHGFFSKDLPISKYLYPSGYQMQGQVSEYYESKDEITLYRAYRLESEREDNYE